MSKQFKIHDVLKDFNNDKTNYISLINLLKSREYANCMSSLTIPIGKDKNGKVVIIDFDNIQNLLVSGAYATGKTSVIFSILISLILQNKHENLKFICIDSMGVEYFPFLNTQYSLFKYEGDSQKSAIQVMNFIIQETNNRLESKTQTPRIVCVIDNFADVQSSFEIKKFNKLNKFINLIPLMNKVGIHMIFSISRPINDVIMDKVKEIFTTRLTFAVAALHDSKRIINNTGAEKLYENNLGSCLLKTKDNISQLQSSYINNQDMLIILEQFKA